MSSSFDFITNSYEKLMLETAYDAITSLELWDYLKTPNKNFMFCVDPEMELIMNEVVKLGYDGHSGASFTWTLKEMQYIAQHSLSQYIQVRNDEEEEERKRRRR